MHSGVRLQVANDVTGGMILRIAYDGDATATFTHRVGFGYGVAAIIGAFGVNIGPDLPNQGAHIEFRENNDSIHVGESS